MFKRLQLTFHVFLLYGFLSLFLLLVGGYALVVIHDYKETIGSLDRQQIPLARTVAEISRHQLDQALRLSEVLFFSRIGDREKFEVGNEGYMQAGKRLESEIVEGRGIVHKGADATQSDTHLEELNTIKTLLKKIEKDHSEYERLGALLIHNIYQHDFLLKGEAVMPGSTISVEAETQKHVAFLRTNLSALEDETRRLEVGIRDAVERVKKLSQTMGLNARQQESSAFSRIVPLLFFALLGGLSLAFAIVKIQKDQEYVKNHLTAQSLLILSNALTQLKSAFQTLEPSSQAVEDNFLSQKGSFGDTVSCLQAILRLSASSQKLSAQIQSLIVERDHVLEKTSLLVQQLRDDAGTLLESAVEAGQAVRNLKETIMQINLLATNASAEASRLEVTQSFSLFTEEIKALARSSALVSETIFEQVDDHIKSIHADRLHVVQTHQQFSEVVDLSKKEKAFFDQATKVIQEQFALLQTVQGAATEVQTALQANDPLLEQTKIARDMAHAQVEIASDVVGGWPR